MVEALYSWERSLLGEKGRLTYLQ